MRQLLRLLMLFGALGILVPAFAAGDPDAANDPALVGPIPESINGVPPGTPPPPEELDRVAHRIGLGLRCPVCQGLSVSDSSAPTAVQMQKRIRALVAAGYTKEDIDAYFMSKYGEWILLAPTKEGLNQIVWIGPALAFLLGLMAAVTFLRRGADSVEASEQPLPPLHDDPYAAQLLAEVDDD